MNMENKDKLKEYMLKEIEIIQFRVCRRHSDASGWDIIWEIDNV